MSKLYSQEKKSLFMVVAEVRESVIKSINILPEHH